MMQRKEDKVQVPAREKPVRNTDELKSLKRKLRRAGQILEHIEEFERIFVHKLKNHLTPIRTCSELCLLDLKNDDPLKERIQIIFDYSKSATDLADAWLLKLHFWLELESESLDETERERYMHGLSEIGAKEAEDQIGFEKRRHSRYLADLPFEYCPIGSFTWGSGRILNISRGGLMAVHSDNFENGQYLLMNVCFPLAHNSRPFKMIGQKIWGSGLGQGQGNYRSGIELVDISSLGLDRLGNLIESSLATRDRPGVKGSNKSHTHPN
jgi:hypothetical protein